MYGIKKGVIILSTNYQKTLLLVDGYTLFYVCAVNDPGTSLSDLLFINLR